MLLMRRQQCPGAFPPPHISMVIAELPDSLKCNQLVLDAPKQRWGAVNGPHAAGTGCILAPHEARHCWAQARYLMAVRCLACRGLCLPLERSPQTKLLHNVTSSIMFSMVCATSELLHGTSSDTDPCCLKQPNNNVQWKTILV